MQPKRIAIIPARSGSVRIKNKNIKSFFNKPMISYPIDALKKSKLFEKIHISTDDIKIKKIVEKLGIKFDFLRSKKLSKNNVIIQDVLKFTLKEYKKKNQSFDEVWLIFACTPFITKEQLISAAEKFSRTKMNYPMMTFLEYDAPIEWAFKKEKNYFKPLNKKKLLVDSQNIKKKYYESATFVIFKEDQVFKQKVFSKYYGHILNKQSAIDIDDMSDWRKAELLFKINKHK
jgi:N-acylneuraminate cytidylyltransferase